MSAARGGPRDREMRIQPRYFLALLLFCAAMLSKTSVVMFPVAILLFGWWKRRRIGRLDLVPQRAIALPSPSSWDCSPFASSRPGRWPAAGSFPTEFRLESFTAGLAIAFLSFQDCFPGRAGSDLSALARTLARAAAALAGPGNDPRVVLDSTRHLGPPRAPRGRLFPAQPCPGAGLRSPRLFRHRRDGGPFCLPAARGPRRTGGGGNGVVFFARPAGPGQARGSPRSAPCWPSPAIATPRSLPVRRAYGPMPWHVIPRHGGPRTTWEPPSPKRAG